MAFTAEDYEVLEPNVYPATFDHTEESEEPSQFGYWIDWYFDAQTADGVVSVMGRSSKPDKFTRSTKARQWHEAILGRELVKGEPADPNSLKGTAVLLTVDVVKTAKGDDRNRIVSIRRAKAQSAKPATETQPSTDEEDAERKAFLAWKASQAKADTVSAEDPQQLPPAPTEGPAENAQAA